MLDRLDAITLHEYRIELDLMRQSHRTILFDQPDRSTLGCKGGNDLLQNGRIVLSGLDIRLGQFRNLVHQGTNSPFGLLYVFVRWARGHSRDQ
jgi:hypothetical protein